MTGNATEYVLTRHGKPVARLSARKDKGVEHRIGLAKGEFEIPEDFDQSSASILAEFEAQAPRQGT